jgi:hypothetical protein
LKGRPVRKNRRQTIDLKAFFNDEDYGDAQPSKRKSEEADDIEDDVEKWAESVIKYHQEMDDMRAA